VDLELAWAVQLNPVLTSLIAHHDERGTVTDPTGQPVTHPIGLTVLADGLLPQRHREQLSARFQRDGVPGRVDGVSGQVAVSRHEPAGALHPRAAQVDFDGIGRVTCGVVAPDFGRVLVDDASTVGLRAAGVVLAVVGVAAQVSAVGKAGVEVADSLVVGQEPHPVPKPHRGGEIAG
jgi:hypothetical protein